MIKTIAHLADIHIRKLHRFVEYRQVFKNLYKQLKELKPVQSGDSDLLNALKIESLVFSSAHATASPEAPN